MSTTLTDRYVYAATRWLPGRTRTEVADELRERIADTVAARGGSAEAERETLEELGDPLRVAVDYSGRTPTLIGPRYFFPWVRLTVVLVAIVAPIIAAVQIATGVVDGDGIGEVIGTAVGAALEGAVHIAFWTTAVFAVLDWTGTAAGSETKAWSLDSLPDPEAGHGSMAELISGVLITVALAVGLLWQHFGSPFTEGGVRIPMADPDLWSWYLPLVLVVLALEVLQCVWVHRAGWTWTVAHFNTVVGLLFTIPTVVVLARNELVNPDLVAHLGWDSSIVAQVTGWSALAVAVVGVWEIADGYRRALVRSRTQ